MMRKVLVFAGSTRADSFNRKLAREAAEVLKKQGFEITLADLADYPMPLYDGDLEVAGGCRRMPGNSRNWPWRRRPG